MRAVSEWCVVLISGTVNACCGGMMQASLMSSYGVIGTLKSLMFFLTSLATFRRRSLLELIYFSAFFPVLSEMISCTTARRFSCKSV